MAILKCKMCGGTLEDKLGQAYEPYIFAALNSAKVMLVVGAKPEHFDAVWVRNEWSRFLKIIKNDRSKLLIEFNCKTNEQLPSVNIPIDESKNYAKVLRFGTEENVQYVENANRIIRNRLTEEAQKRQQADERDIYYDVNCPNCGAELSYAKWQADAFSNVCCPIYDKEFTMDFDRQTARVNRDAETLTCPICHTSQLSNRSRCWKYGVFFI